MTMDKKCKFATDQRRGSKVAACGTGFAHPELECLRRLQCRTVQQHPGCFIPAATSRVLHPGTAGAPGDGQQLRPALWKPSSGPYRNADNQHYVK